MTQGTKVAFRHRVHGDCLAGRECVHWPLAPVAACTAVRGALERASWLPVKLLVVLALASCFAFPGEFLLQASTRLALPLGGHARSPIRRANDRLRLSAGSPGHRRIPPVGVFALRDVRAGFMFAAQAACRACLGLLFRLSRRVPSASVQKTRPPLGGQARSPIRRANDRLRLSAGSPGHRRIPPVAVFALRDYITRDFLATRQ